MRKRDTLIRLAGALLLVAGPGMAQTARYDIVNYGAVGDGKTNNAAAINRAISAAARAGGGTVLVPPGDFVSGPITLLTNVTLRMEAGSMIRGSTRVEDYQVQPDPASGRTGRGTAGLISARDARNIAITGRGVIEGSAIAFMKTDQVLDLAYATARGSNWIPRLTRQGEEFMSARFGTESGPFAFGPRPGRMVDINNCDNVTISGVTLQNSPSWTLSLTNSRHVDIVGVKINSLASGRRVPNDDGIDLTNCRFVHIADCDFQTGDDCVAVFGAENLTVTNCTLSSHDSGIRVGPDFGNETRNATFSNLVINTATRGININVRIGGVIENLLFDTIVIRTQLITGYWWGKGEPVHISAVPRSSAEPAGVIRNLRFSNILAESEAGILIYGTKESVIRDIQFDGVRLKVKAGPLSESYGGNFDLRGMVPSELSIFKHDIPGLYSQYVDGLKIRNFELQWADKLPEFFSHGIECENFRNLDINDYVGRQAGGAGSSISLSNGSGVTIRNSVAAEGTETFLSHTGVAGDIVLAGDDLSRAKVAISPARAIPAQAGNILPPGGARKR